MRAKRRCASYNYRYGSRLYGFTSNFPGESNETLEYRGDGKLHRRTSGTDVTVYRYGAGWDPVVNENGSGTVLGAWVMTPGARGKKLAYVTGGLQGTSPMYTYADHLGSIRRARLQDVSRVGSDEFEPYGGMYAATGSLSVLHGAFYDVSQRYGWTKTFLVVLGSIRRRIHTDAIE